MTLSGDLQEYRDKKILDFLAEPHTIKEIAKHIGLSYGYTIRMIKSLHERKFVIIHDHRDNKEILYKAGSPRPMPTFRVPTGQVWSLVDFVKLFQTNENFEFESARLTNLLPQMCVEMHYRAHELKDGQWANTEQRYEWRKYLEALRVQLNNTLSVVSQMLTTARIWDDNLLVTILQDPEAISRETIDELMAKITTLREVHEDVSST